MKQEFDEPLIRQFLDAKQELIKTQSPSAVGRLRAAVGSGMQDLRMQEPLSAERSSDPERQHEMKGGGF